MQQHSVHEDLEIPFAAVVNNCFNLKPVTMEPGPDHLDNTRRMLGTVAGAPYDDAGMGGALRRLLRKLLGIACGLGTTDGMPYRLLPSRLVTQPHVTGHPISSCVAFP